jgi:hypothetical protein
MAFQDSRIRSGLSRIRSVPKKSDPVGQLGVRLLWQLIDLDADRQLLQKLEQRLIHAWDQSDGHMHDNNFLLKLFKAIVDFLLQRLQKKFQDEGLSEMGLKHGLHQEIRRGAARLLCEHFAHRGQKGQRRVVTKDNDLGSCSFGPFIETVFRSADDPDGLMMHGSKENGTSCFGDIKVFVFQRKANRLRHVGHCNEKSLYVQKFFFSRSSLRLRRLKISVTIYLLQ